jgi:hypothetical protein
MEYIIYVELLDEGSVAYRPVIATHIQDNIYRINHSDYDINYTEYDTEDEKWEFSPNTIVRVVEKTDKRNNAKFLLAVEKG